MTDHTGPEGAFTEHDGERYSPEMRLTKKGKPDRRYRLGKRQGKNSVYSARQRLLILDAWTRSGLSATDFASICQVPASTLYEWRRRFMEDGPAGLENKPRGPGRGSKLDSVTRRAILMLKGQNPDWGIQRIHDVLRRSEGFSASPAAIRRLLKQAGYELTELPAKRHPDKPRSFERAAPNRMWQTDLFTFTLKRSKRRVHLVGFMDDHSRFIVGFTLHASAAGAMVRECLQAAIARFGAPREVLTDRGTQYHPHSMVAS